MDVKELNLEELHHEHPLIRIDLQVMHRDYEEDNDDYDDNELIAKQNFKCTCDRCGTRIDWYHRYYYKCSMSSCNYSIHKFCEELPKTLKFQGHPSDHTLILTKKQMIRHVIVVSGVIELAYVINVRYEIDLLCATFVEQNTIHHPGHPHPLLSVSFERGLNKCFACGEKHEGCFYQCVTCFNFLINFDCLSHPVKLLLETKHFSHAHLLTLSYSFLDRLYDFECRICGMEFEDDHFIYMCSKCMYYVHPKCATQRTKNFMSIHSPGLVEREKNFKDADYPNLLHFPLYDGSNILSYQIKGDSFACFNHRKIPREKSYFSNYMTKIHNEAEKYFNDDDCPQILNIPLDDVSHILAHKIKGDTLAHLNHRKITWKKSYFSHYMTKQNNETTSTSEMISSAVSHQDPMKRIKLLCTGCTRPITQMPFFKCSTSNECHFVLHDWCSRLPKELTNHVSHSHHTLHLFDFPSTFGFGCSICRLPCNGFSYRCISCHDYIIDVNCAFIPKEITHKAHANHLLTIVDPSSSPHPIYDYLVRSRQTNNICRACRVPFEEGEIFFDCSACDFHLDCRCAFNLPKTIRHKLDKHSLTLTYSPVEDHKSPYFCEVCEKDLDPRKWFYHCVECAQSIHSACAPLILQSEQDVNSLYVEGVYKFINIKFGAVEKNDFHQHPVLFAPGTLNDGLCQACGCILQSSLIWKCLHCIFARHVISCEHRPRGMVMHRRPKPIGYDWKFFGSYWGKNPMVKDRPQRNLKFYPSKIMRPVTRHWKVAEDVQ